MLAITLIVGMTLVALTLGYIIGTASQRAERTEFENTGIRLASEILAAEKYGWTGIPDSVLQVARELHEQGKKIR